MINQAEFQAWKNDTVTQAVLDKIRETLKSSEDMILDGTLIFDPDGRVKMAAELGFQRGLRAVLEVVKEEQYE